MGVAIDQMSKAGRSEAGRTLSNNRHPQHTQDLKYQVAGP
jgi:hypothetical protein